MRVTLIGIAVLMLVLVTSAKGDVDFLGNAQFSYGMGITAADQRLADGGSDFEVFYRVDTPSTIQFAATYKETEFYLMRFYQGVCFSIERRSEVSSSDVEHIFRTLTELHGETPEATQSRDQQLWYSHWMKKDRDVEITASQREGELYIITYEEYDPMVMGEALMVMEQEVGDTSYEVDPLTGKPRPISHTNPESQGEGGESGNTEEGSAGEQGAADGESDETEDDPPPEDDEYDDFDW